MQYRIEDLLEADFGCEERQEGAPLMCCLALTETGDERKKIFCNIPDFIVEECHLQRGQILSEEELGMMKEGRKPVSHLTIRKTEEKDLPEVFAIYDHARKFMKEHGNPRQWGDKWPPENLIREDIRRGKSYICEADGKIAAAFFYDCGKDVEPGYTHIEDGKFTGPEVYGVVHRIAVAGNGHGVGSFCINWAFLQSGGNLRMDTHPDNKIMQHTLKKIGFQYCGIIHVVEDNDPRYAYEKYEDMQET